jgi:ABC-2 type transport system ATP-binding protein
VRALNDVTLSVGVSEVFGYLGPNGAGKTTTLKVLFGLVRRERGTIEVLGLPHADRAWRGRVGYLPEHPYLYDSLTPREYLAYAAQLSGVLRSSVSSRVDAVLEQVGLGSSRDKLMRTFSKGMVQRAGLAQALVGDPDLLILDEPMSGLDPIGRASVRRLILDLKRAGKTIFFSTHILSDAETLCDRVAILRLGRVVSQGPLSEILKVDVEHLEVDCTGIPVRDWICPAGATVVHRSGDHARCQVDEQAFFAFVREIESHGGRILTVQPKRKSLEEVFVEEVQGSGAGAPWEA